MKNYWLERIADKPKDCWMATGFKNKKIVFEPVQIQPISPFNNRTFKVENVEIREAFKISTDATEVSELEFVYYSKAGKAVINYYYKDVLLVAEFSGVIGYCHFTDVTLSIKEYEYVTVSWAKSD